VVTWSAGTTEGGTFSTGYCPAAYPLLSFLTDIFGGGEPFGPV